MRLRTALDEYKRGRGRDERFPAECPTTDGALSGSDERLVHVDTSGALRDYSAPLSGRSGLDRSRLGVDAGDGVDWFDGMRTLRQGYCDDTALVETEHDAGDYAVGQHDCTLGQDHLTAVEVRGSVPDGARLVAYLGFAPGGRESGVGRLVHDRDDGVVLEAFGREESDFAAASTGIDAVRGQVPESFESLLADASTDVPRDGGAERYEQAHLSGEAVVVAPLERHGEGDAYRTTLLTRLRDRSGADRGAVLADVAATAAAHATPGALRAVATAAAPDRRRRIDDDGVVADIRALSLLSAPSGARIAAPEFDPFYANTGGYGYAWLRDDAAVGLSLLAATDRLPMTFDDELARSAAVYCESQLEDGTWPHRLWAVDGSLAPGWANGRRSGADPTAYQADQTAGVVAFLATLLRDRPTVADRAGRTRLETALTAGIEGLDATLAADGLPERCQNCWENAHGRFTHTAAAFLRAYSAVASAPVEDGLVARSRARAGRVRSGLDALWTGDRYGLGLDVGDDDGIDERFDSATFALVSAVAAADAVEPIPDRTVRRLRSHVRRAVEGLHRETDAVAGLVRFEGDDWRTAGQDRPKIWTLSTVWGALACVRLAALLTARGEEAEEWYDRSRRLHALVAPDGPLVTDAGHLAEQAFDDGTHDSATPLGWAHALRLETTARLAARDELGGP